jgi:TRAP-type C4-dicarboxylate transport system permease large subunit
MDIYTAIVVLAPLVTPLGVAYGIHPVHLGIVFLANLELGYLTPPVGMNLFFASYRFNKPIVELFRAVLPLFVAIGVALLAVTYLPWLSTGLPAFAGSR